MDPANSKASQGLISLEQASGKKDEEQGTTADADEYQDSNFEMIEAQQLTPEVFPDIDVESDAMWSDEVEVASSS